MEKSIRYNFYFDTVSKACYLKGGAPVSVTCIENVRTDVLAGIEKERLPWVQMFDSGVRQTAEMGDDYIEGWNGCVFVDLDSKKFGDEQKRKVLTSRYDEFMKGVNDWLSEMYTHNYYWSQRSASGNSAHFVFYYECEKNIANFTACAVLAKEAVAQACRSVLSFGEELVLSDGVLDECSNKPCQLMYISAYPVLFNNYKDALDNGGITGQVEQCRLESAVCELVSDDAAEGIDSIDVEFDRSGKPSLRKKTCPPGSWNHAARLAMLKCLAYYYMDDVQSAVSLYTEFVDLIVGHSSHNHSKSQLIGLFKSQYSGVVRAIKHNADWTRVLSRSKLRVCRDWLGINFVMKQIFHPHEPKKIEYDEVIDLKPSESIATHIKRIIESEYSVQYIVAGCGLGKTFSAKQYVRDSMSADCINIFSIGQGKRLCFVTPMTSINRDNFDDDSNWAVVDHEHPDTSIEGKSVCTTWNSFCSREMYLLNFDAFIFDEMHSVYLYDYRTRDIALLFKAVDRLVSEHKKVIMMSGTPGREIERWQARRVLFRKVQREIPCTITVYNKSYAGALYDDIKKWISESEKHTAVVMCDTANQNMVERIEWRGIKVDKVYNKAFSEDVQEINTEHRIQGQVCLVSTYGQAGINIYADEGQSMRLYVLNNNAMSIIQYINRIRNKEHVDRVMLYYPREDLGDGVSEGTAVDADEVQKKVEALRSMRPAVSSDEEGKKEYRVINYTLSLSAEYVDFDRLVVLDDCLEIYREMQHTKHREHCMQSIWSRLVDAWVKVEFSYPAQDVKDEARGKFGSSFAGAIKRFDALTDLECRRGTGRMSFEFKPQSKQLEHFVIGSLKSDMEYICEYFAEGKHREEQKRSAIDEGFKNFLAQIEKKTGTVRKSDIEHFAEVIHLKKHLAELSDRTFVILLNKNRNEMSDEKFIEFGANCAAWECEEGVVSEELAVLAGEEACNRLKSVHAYIEQFDWFIDFGSAELSTDESAGACEGVRDGVLDLSEEVSIDAKVQWRNRIYTGMIKRWEKKKKRGAVKKKVECIFDDGRVSEFNSINECADALGVTRITVQSALKSGKKIKKLGAVLRVKNE